MKWLAQVPKKIGDVTLTKKTCKYVDELISSLFICFVSKKQALSLQAQGYQIVGIDFFFLGTLYDDGIVCNATVAVVVGRRLVWLRSFFYNSTQRHETERDMHIWRGSFVSRINYAAQCEN